MRFSLSLFTAIAAATGASAMEPQTPDQDPWYQAGQRTLEMRRAIKPNTKKAKNVILFVADGMDPTTVTAARIYDGQSRGQEGEENFLSFELFPYVAMSKTYNTNAQTPDSAGTMTAMVTGVKTKAGMISVSDAAGMGECAAGKAAEVKTLGELAEQAGMATGVISTARLTHATPAAVYSHAANRGWESDTDLSEEAIENGCADIASQLIDFPYGDGLEVAMGGGRSNFLPAELADPRDDGEMGRRRDQRNLADEWTAKSDNHAVVYDRDELAALDDNARPLGLFDRSHMDYEADRLTTGRNQPSLTEMTEKAISILSDDKDGYFLMVEAGRVDHAHHGGNAARALRDAQEFSNAIAAARAMTDDKETLVVVTADHGHTMAFQGYPAKGNNILGLTNSVFPQDVNEDGHGLAADGKPYTTLVYANGPGSVFVGDNKEKAERHAPTPEEVADLNYRQQALIPARSESHGGQDVTIYANGPRAYLIGGVVEQNYIYHVIEDALQLKKRAEKAKR